MEEVNGRVSTIIYKNDDNGYIIFKIESEGKEITVVGYLPYVSEGQNVKVTGEYIVNPKFGKQLKASLCEEVVPSTTDEIEKYLSSGIIYGIGPVTAKKIVSKFKDKALDILDNNIERLKEIEGIGEKKLKTIMESYVQQRTMRNIIIFYQGHGVLPTTSVKIFKILGPDCINKTKENPYILCDMVKGIGFKTSDMIASSMGVSKDSCFRIGSGIRKVINDYCSNGNTYIEIDELYKECSALLDVDKDKIKKVLYDEAAENKIVIEEHDGKTCVFALPYYYCELGITKRILTLAINNFNILNIDVNFEISLFEKKNNISFADSQKEAIIGAVNNGIEIITGGPGTGKTTIIKCIIEIFDKCGMKVLLGAPTGRAAKRMTESTHREAKTIHRLLDVTVADNILFEGDSVEPLDGDVIIIDEASMIDITLMNNLLKAIKVGTRLILVGDVDQLPSVGPGNVLGDLINSNFTKVVRLNEIFRQGKESMIIVNAHRINEGLMPYLNKKDKDFFFLKREGNDNVLNTIIELINTRLPKFNKEWDKLKDMQVLTPTRKGTLGVSNLNESLQEILNPKKDSKNEILIGSTIFRVGDKVMQTKNNYQLEWNRILGEGENKGLGVFNGDVGIIEKINTENKSIHVIFDEERRVIYDSIYADELELAYAITIHKSQGSEFPVVVIPAFMGAPLLMNRNLLYTGITRAAKLVVIVGTEDALKYMIDNISTSERHSSLMWRIKDIMSEDIFSEE